MGAFHGCGCLTSQKLVFPVVQRWPAHAEPVGDSLGAFITCAEFHDARLHQRPGIPSSPRTADDRPSCLRKGLANPGGERPSAGVAQCPHGGRNAAVVSEVVFDRCRFLRMRELGCSARIARRQVELLLVLVVPALQRILCWITELTDGRPHALAQLDVELNCSNTSFVGIHELPPDSPSFRPHPRRGRIPWKSTDCHQRSS